MPWQKHLYFLTATALLTTMYFYSFLQHARVSPVFDCGIPSNTKTRPPNSVTNKSFYNSGQRLEIWPPAVLLEAKGRAGNQLFQYACHYALARKHRWPLYILMPDKEEDYIDFILDHLNIPMFPQNLVHMNNWSIGEQGFFKDSTLLIGNYEYDKVLSQDGWDFCQSEVYFSEFKEEILSYFTQNHIKSNGEPTEFEKKWTSRIDAVKESVGIHVRRGDMVDLNISVPITFQIKYMTELYNKFWIEEGRAVEFFVFTDDIPYVIEHLVNISSQSLSVGNSTPNIHLVSETGDNDASYDSTARGLEELFLMAKCKHQIIPGSTFSWWAAYLNPYPDKIVYAANLKSQYFKELYKEDFYEWHYKYLFYPLSWISVDPGWSNEKEKTNDTNSLS